MPLCSLCQQITPWTVNQIEFDEVRVARPEFCNPHHKSFLALRKSSISCELCRLMHKSLSDNRYTPGRSIQEDAPILIGSKSNLYTDPKIEAPQLCEIVVQCGQVFTKLLAFADPRSEAALSNAVSGRLPLDPNSQASFRIVSKWLENCAHTHPSCRIRQIGQVRNDMPWPESAKLPPRAIDIGDSANSTIRLIESSHITGQYVTLSHRWPTDPSKHFTTTKSNIHDRKRGFSLKDMPQIFQDVVKVTRQLGFRYLWIDSLCIVQNDAEDWEQQSSLMGQIYYRATLTIMAATTLATIETTDQEHAHEGFLCRPPGPVLPVVQMDYYDQNWERKGNWFVQYQDNLLFEDSDLFTRGWVMQEQLLSRRKIIYTPNQLFWQCNSMQIFEVNRERVVSYERYMNYKVWHESRFTDHWLGTAELYSYRKLTFESDKLPALSGLASHFSERHGQEYHAGLFSGSIAEGLLWAPYTPGCLSRPAKYIAPSWGWTSLVGRIKMRAPLLPVEGRDSPEDGSLPESMLEDVRFNLSPEGQDPHGRLRGGMMELTGWLKSAQMCRARSEAHLLMNVQADGKAMASFVLDLAEYAPAPSTVGDVECLAVLQDNENVIVLRKVRNSDPNVYERIGIAVVDPEWFRVGNARKTRIIII